MSEIQWRKIDYPGIRKNIINSIRRSYFKYSLKGI